MFHKPAAPHPVALVVQGAQDGCELLRAQVALRRPQVERRAHAACALQGGLTGGPGGGLVALEPLRSQLRWANPRQGVVGIGASASGAARFLVRFRKACMVGGANVSIPHHIYTNQHTTLRASHSIVSHTWSCVSLPHGAF